jgi:hypothetical protein
VILRKARVPCTTAARVPSLLKRLFSAPWLDYTNHATGSGGFSGRAARARSIERQSAVPISGPCTSHPCKVADGEPLDPLEPTNSNT